MRRRDRRISRSKGGRVAIEESLKSLRSILDIWSWPGVGFTTVRYVPAPAWQGLSPAAHPIAHTMETQMAGGEWDGQESR